MFLDTLKKSNSITLKYHGDKITLERAIFLSWWCDKGDCNFCYLASKRHKIKDSTIARRRLSSILAEVEILNRIGWRVEFLSTGYGSHKINELHEIAQMVSHVTGQGVWLNVGVLTEKQLGLFNNEIEGIVASIETLDPNIRDRICPNKTIEDSIQSLSSGYKLGLKKAATIVLGLGEGPIHIENLLEFIQNMDLDRITVYSLNPQKGTPFSNTPQPASLYQAGIIALIRIRFPKLEIIGGTWIDQLPNIGPIILAGATAITKYPLFSMFGNRYGLKVEEEVKYANRTLLGTFSDIDILKGNKKLHKSKNPQYHRRESQILISDKIIKKVQNMREDIDDKIEGYVTTVLKRRKKFIHDSQESHHCLN